MALEVEHRGNKHRHYHAYCVNGGLHPDDTVEGFHALSAEFRHEIEAARISRDDWVPEIALPIAQVPRTVRQAAEVRGQDGGPG